MKIDLKTSISLLLVLTLCVITGMCVFAALFSEQENKTEVFFPVFTLFSGTLTAATGYYFSRKERQKKPNENESEDADHE